VGDIPFYAEIWRMYRSNPLQNADFQSIYDRSASAVTPSKKVQLTLIGSPLSAYQWAQYEQCSLRCP